MKTKHWVIAALDEPRVRMLAHDCACAPLTAAVLSARGIDTAQAAERYLSCDSKGLHDPFLMRRYGQGSPRPSAARLMNNEHIVVLR